MDRVSFGRLFDEIIMSCQQKAKELEGFESGDGCIRISYLPQNTWAANILESEVHSADRFELLLAVSEDVFSICRRYLLLTGRSVESTDNPCRFLRSTDLCDSHLPGCSME